MSKLGKRLINAAKSETKPIRQCPENQWGEGPGCGSESRQGVARRKVVAHCMRNEANSNRPRIHRRLRWRIGVRLRRPKKREGSLVIATSQGVREGSVCANGNDGLMWQSSFTLSHRCWSI